MIIHVVYMSFGFDISSSRSRSSSSSSSSNTQQLFMFGGAGAGAPTEDDPEQMAAMQKMAGAMGMSVEEYQLGMRARTNMEESINTLRVVGGNEAKGVTVERDGNSPPKHLKVTVTDDGKALGKVALEKEIISALKQANELSKKGREDAQAGMMQFISSEMKRMGA
mmetsp:Transcript_25473/g.24407  ORF Transcript_25473/g.24407 Transcript_25473/m.24407 type:complete len:166 (-) Transcript_25473:349-846(-)